MTTGNSEQVSTTDPKDQSPVDQAIAAGAQAPQQPSPAPEADVEDIDAKEVADALAAAQAEKAAAANGSDNQGAGGNQSQQQPNQAQQDQTQQQAGQQQPAGDPVMIPKPRFDEALGRATKAEQDAAYWKGVADARGQQPAQQGGQQGQPQQQQQPTAQDRLTAIHKQQDELATKFDNGEITYSDMLKQQRELSGQEQGIREEVLTSRLQPQPAPQGASDELYLNERTKQLEDGHPWVKVFDQVGTKHDWDYVQAQAKDNLIARGINPANGTIGKYELRQEVAVLMDKLGPGLLTERATAKGIAIPGQQQPAQQQQQQGNNQQNLSAEAKARLDKLNLSANAPPNLQRMQGSTNDGTPSEASLETMSDDDIGNLPDATRRRLLNIIPA